LIIILFTSVVSLSLSLSLFLCSIVSVTGGLLAMIQESDRRDRLAHSQDDGTVNRNVKYLKKKKSASKV